MDRNEHEKHSTQNHFFFYQFPQQIFCPQPFPNTIIRLSTSFTHPTISTTLQNFLNHCLSFKDRLRSSISAGVRARDHIFLKHET